MALALVAACSSGSPSPSKAPPREMWATADYVQAGVPSLDVAWTAEQDAKAAEVLAKVAKEDAARLPRFQGAKSGEVFGRLIAPLPEPPGGLMDRVTAHLKRYEAINQISKLYVDVSDPTGVPPREYIELIGALLVEATSMTPSLETFLTSIPADDPSLPTRRRGLEKMRVGWAGLIWGATLTAGDLRVPTDDRAALMRHVVKALPVLYPFCLADDRRRIADQVSALQDALDDGPLKDAVDAAADVIAHAPARNL